MKKSFFLPAVLMMSMSCAFWTGCSDDDNATDNGGGIPTDTIPPVDTIAPIKDTVYQLKSIRMNDLQNEGFYTSINMTFTGKNVTGLTKAGYTPEGKVNGPVLNASINYSAGKATLTYSRDGVNHKVDYVLNEKGYATKASLYQLEEGQDPYLGSESYFTYNGKGMLERIYTVVDESEVDIFNVTFKNDTVWNTCLVDAESSLKANCAFSDVKNNYTVDMNVFSIASGYMEEVDYAIVCGLLPSSSKILKSLTNEEEGVAITYTEAVTDKKVSTLKMGMGADLLKDLSFGY